MVQSVTLELSALNALPGVAGVEDVSVDIPQLDDIGQVVQDAVLTPDDIQQALEGDLVGAIEDAVALDELADLLADALQDELNIQIPETVELDIEGSLFDVEQDLVDLLAEAVEEALEALGLADDLAALGEDIQAALDAIEDLSDPLDLDEIETTVEEAVAAAVPDLDVPQILEDPEALLDTVLDALEDRLVSETAKQELEEAREVLQ